MQGDGSDRLDGLVDVNRRDLLKGMAVTPIAGVSLSEVASADDGVRISVRQNGSEVATVSPITADPSIGNFYRYDEIDGASANNMLNAASKQLGGFINAVEADGKGRGDAIPDGRRVAFVEAAADIIDLLAEAEISEI